MCVFCYSKAMNLKCIYYNECILIFSEDERRLYLLHTIIYLRAKNSFVPTNETRIQVELKYARYLALKNFSQQAYDILMEVKSNILLQYNEDVAWLSFYSEMLLIIKVILYYSVEENLNPMPIMYLEELCKFGLYVINGQQNHICLLKKYSCEYTEIFEEKYLFLKWKERIHYISSLLNMPTFEEHKSKEIQDEDLPGLVKIKP
ncbi:uncharacterized protein LOC118757219 [Rhagoletis pomonella]|uniref:uncharacterized protein LOC118757215 n=1 Tax=Rhagoletis pomonella TaxID=28610 RepID=UPI00178165C0|nr:uncharacterized protein LOC118757215 [Rhagoletis pomonella]XP_036347842.1 uncharacterized protein LOC118757219 [Rhagoletis pomonella]